MPIKKLSLQAIGALLFLRFASADIFYVKSNQFDAAALSDGQNVSYIYVTVPATTIVQTITTTLYDGKKHKSIQTDIPTNDTYGSTFTEHFPSQTSAYEYPSSITTHEYPATTAAPTGEISFSSTVAYSAPVAPITTATSSFYLGDSLSEELKRPIPNYNDLDNEVSITSYQETAPENTPEATATAIPTSFEQVPTQPIEEPQNDYDSGDKENGSKGDKQPQPHDSPQPDYGNDESGEYRSPHKATPTTKIDYSEGEDSNNNYNYNYGKDDSALPSLELGSQPQNYSQPSYYSPTKGSYGNETGWKNETEKLPSNKTVKPTPSPANDISEVTYSDILIDEDEEISSGASAMVSVGASQVSMLTILAICSVLAVIS